MYRIGQGFDLHRLVEGRALFLGGVKIEHTKGLLGHSDADVLVHAIIDSLLGALCLGDIGQHFPDTDLKYKDANSLELLAQVLNMVENSGYEIVNIDSTIQAQEPKLMPHILSIRENLAKKEKDVIQNENSSQKQQYSLTSKDTSNINITINALKNKGR